MFAIRFGDFTFYSVIYTSGNINQKFYIQDSEAGGEDKPLSASDITAIAESTVNQLLMREERKESDRGSRSRRRSRSRDRSRSSRSPGGRARSRSREKRRSRERSAAKSSATTTMSRLEKLKDPRIVTLKGLKAFHKENDVRLL